MERNNIMLLCHKRVAFQLMFCVNMIHLMINLSIQYKSETWILSETLGNIK
jgi:hypothetical protein